MTDQKRPEYALFALVVLLALAVAALDALLPLRHDLAVAYIVPIPLVLWSRRFLLTCSMAAAITVLALLGLFLSPSTGADEFTVAATNRLLVLIVVWATAITCALRQEEIAQGEPSDDERRRARANEEKLRRAEETCKESQQELDATRDVAVYALAKVAESRDAETGQHLERIRAYSRILADELRKDPAYADMIDDVFLTDLYRSSALHDIGKVGVRDAILLKPGRLTAEEFETMKRHTTVGTNILEDAVRRKGNAEFLQMAALIARCHHERFDGTGYPNGLSGVMIPLAARIVAVADVFDAICSARPYKEPVPPDKARRIIEEEAGAQFDPGVVQAFSRRYEDFVTVQLRYPDSHVQIFGLTESILAEVCP